MTSGRSLKSVARTLSIIWWLTAVPAMKTLPADHAIIFSNFLKLACTDIASEGNNSKRLSLRDIIKHIFSTHRVKFGAPSRKNEVTGYNVLMGKSLCRTLYVGISERPYSIFIGRYNIHNAKLHGQRKRGDGGRVSLVEKSAGGRSPEIKIFQ